MKLLIACATALALSGLGLGCGGDAPPPPPSGNAAPADQGGPGQPAGQPGGGQRQGGDASPMPSDLPPLPVRDISERDFLESPANRDPFRDFAELFVVKPQAQDPSKGPQREVLVAKYALEELKVVGIVTGSTGRALVTDPTGLGWVLRVGDFVGRSESVHSGGPGGIDVALNWRVDRIRPNDIVFIREDPSRPDVPATTRVLSLRSEAEMNTEIQTGIRGRHNDDDEGSKGSGPAPKPRQQGPAKPSKG
jgi:type IV pilus assembly protein PilP